MVGRYYRRLKWLFWGEVARLLVEEYESPADAIVFPLLAASVGGSMLWTAIFMYESATTSVRLLPATITALLGGAIIGMGVLAAAASVVYATRTTEVDRPMGVHDGRA